MKKQLILILICSIILPLSIFSQSISDKKGWELCAQRKSQMLQSPKSALSPITPKHKFDVLKYTINTDIYNCFLGSYPNSFNASVRITFKVDTALNSIDLNAVNSSMVIDNVSEAASSFQHNNDILTLSLNQTYAVGDTVSVKINYHHLNVNDHAFYTDGGFVFTDCEPEGARKWFPCWDRPSDKALLDLTAKVPLAARLGSNGHLADSIISGDTIYYHWVTRDPISTYLVVMTAKIGYQLDIVYCTNPNSPGSPPTPIRFYYNAGENPFNVEAEIANVYTFFSEKFCPHPFEKNGFATLNNQFAWGGMENQTLTSLCPGCWYEGIVVHEFAHQWFGDMVTCGTWADIFLNEGFATYCEALWYEHSIDYPAYKNDINNDANSYFGGNPGWPISQPAWAVTTPPVSDLFNYATTYAKGACVLHQLRYVMGDSLFFAGMKLYSNDTANIKYQAALISDFELHMEQVYGQPLDWFFNEWIYEPNHPVYANTYSIASLGNGQWKVGFFTKQTQTNTVFFKMPLEIRVKFIDNTDTIIRVMNDLNGQAYSFYFSKQPNQVNFDYGNDIVLKESTTIVGLEENPALPDTYLLSQNIPNPASTLTEISYFLPESADVMVKVYDVSGSLIKSINQQHQSTGDHSLTIDVTDLQNGFYFYTFQVNGYSTTRKMIVTH